MKPSQGAPAREAALALLGLAALACILYAPSLFGGGTILMRDLFTQFEGPRWWYQQSLRAGELPYWNPYIACGTPFLANPQNSVLYPFSLLFAVMPFGSAIGIFAAVHSTLLGLFSYFLGRELGLSFWGALMGGIVAGFAGIPLKQVEFPEMLAGFTWTPLVLLGAWRCLKRPAPRSAALLGAALGLQFLAGSPYPPLYSGLGILCVVVALSIGKRKRGQVTDSAVGPPDCTIRNLTPFVWLGLGLVLGLLIGCAQYIPTLLLVRDLSGDRMSGVLESRFSLRLRDLFDFIGPWFAGFPNWQKCFYVGITALFLAGMGLASWRKAKAGQNISTSFRLSRDSTIFCLLIILAGVIFAQADYLRLDRVIDALPFVRRAGKWPTLALSLTVLGLGLLGGAGLQQWLDRKGAGAAKRDSSDFAKPGTFIPLVLIVLFALVMGVDALRGGRWLGSVRSLLEQPMLVFQPSSMLPANTPVVGEAERLAFVGIALAALIVLKTRGIPGRWLGPAACILAAAELLTAGRSIDFQAPVDLYSEAQPPAVGRLLGDGFDAGSCRILVPQLFDRFGDMAYGSRRLDDFRMLRNLYDQDTVMHWRVFTTQGGGTVPLPEYTLALQPALDALALWGTPAAYRILGAWNISVILSGNIDASGLHCDFLHNGAVLPRVRLMERIAGVPSESDALAAVARGEWDPSSALAAWEQHVPEFSPGDGEPGEVDRVDYGPAGIRVHCRAVRPCLVVLAENWAEGWSATVDGAPTTLYRVNFLQQAVRLEPGRHEIAWHYVAPGAHLGFLLAGLGLAGVGICAARRKI